MPFNCNIIKKRKIVEDFIHVNPKCISNCKKMLIPRKKYDK